MTLTHVLTPFDIGPVRVKNRVVRTAHTTMIGAGSLSDDLIAYHEARARGGVGLSVMEAMSVHPSSLMSLNLIDPTLGEKYPRMMDRLRPTGMRVFQQLMHGGHHGAQLDGSPPWSPSDVPSVQNGLSPVPMTKAMIDAVVEGFAKAAAAVESWGGEGVEIHCAHGFLIQQFLSTYANHREDDYGGSFENRARFMVEVLQAVRANVSTSFVVGIRVGPDLLSGGVGVEDNLRAAQLAEELALTDYVSISSGTFQTIHKMIGGMHEPAGFEMVTSGPISTQLKGPRIVVGRFRTLEEADQTIRAGEADLVGMVRATLAEPDLVRKTMEGRPEEARPCIACNQGCIGQLFGPPGRVGCAVNAAAGFEQTMGDDKLTRAESPKKVLVVGGGPAGMEAARVAALRGHKVVLAEAEQALGGAIKLAGMAPARGGIRDIIIWQEQEIYRLGVDVRLSTFMEADDVAGEAPDHVIIATGSMPRMDGVQSSNPGEPIEGIERPNVVSTHDLFLGGRSHSPRSAVVIDDLGHYEAIAAAEHLVNQGAEVTFVTRHNAFAPLVEPALMTEPALQRMSRGRFAVRVRTRAITIEADGVVVGPTYLQKGSNQGEKIPAEMVVFVSRNRPNRDLAPGLEERGVPFTLVGDAKSPAFIQMAIRDGNLAGAAV